MGHHGAMGDEGGRVASTRGRQVGRDMVISMAVVGLAIGVWMFFVHPRTPDPVKAVDWSAVATQAALGNPYPLLAPAASFPWTATSAWVQPEPDGTVIWQLGFYTPAQDYAAVVQRGVFPEQAQGSVEEWIAAQTRNGEERGSVDIGGGTWTRLEGDPTPDDKRSLVSEADGTVTIVTGSAQWAELEQLAAALQPVRP
jgi:hypothetical protein